VSSTNIRTQSKLGRDRVIKSSYLNQNASLLRLAGMRNSVVEKVLSDFSGNYARFLAR
jgi:hypothetical protein